MLGCATPPVEETELSTSSKVQIRWFVGLEIGADFKNITALDDVVADFNSTQDEIELVLEIASIAGAYDLFAIELSNGVGPDIVGPISRGMASGFANQWLPIDPFLAESGFDTTVYDSALLEMYQTENGETLSLPFAASPSGLYYIPAMFDEAGLDYPPQVYGQMYELDGRILPWNWDTLAEVAKRLTIDANNNNATHPQFDRNNIVQVGLHPQGQSMTALATFFGAAKIYEDDVQGNYISTIPDNWKMAWQWWHNGIWGEQPFMVPTYSGEPVELGTGNMFHRGQAAMSLSQSTYTCCLTNLRDNGVDFQAGVLPVDGEERVNGRISETSFYIWQGTAHPEEAFEVLTYLLTTGSDSLLPAYDAMPAATDQIDTFIAQKAVQYPTVTPASWHVFVQGLAYPDNPSADQYLPNRNEAINRLRIFGDSLATTQISDFDVEFQKIQEDLTQIYNK